MSVTNCGDKKGQLFLFSEGGNNMRTGEGKIFNKHVSFLMDRRKCFSENTEAFDVSYCTTDRLFLRLFGKFRCEPFLIF